MENNGPDLSGVRGMGIEIGAVLFGEQPRSIASAREIRFAFVVCRATSVGSVIANELPVLGYLCRIASVGLRFDLRRGYVTYDAGSNTAPWSMTTSVSCHLQFSSVATSLQAEVIALLLKLD
jgi:hypothetical protein